ncbi:nucleoside monophosphate kinase [Blattabacterium cuenoti]|uniref:nucleoside monophosphate kinase n=1 Tax=Blattabacterium cuenoti TaxID=1653831 RepID=UPI00163B904D|nr:nucleoside monophosphate kinase [Blattabacterium cuenoti]
MIHIILFGPPGCGKGTQARIIANKFGFIHLSTGMIFRNHIKNETSLGMLAKHYINQGILVPDKITTSMLNIEMKKYIQAKGIIYDGYPRTKNQIFSLEKILNRFSFGRINVIFSFHIKNNLLINRLIKRGKISKRNDDINMKTVQKRIEEYDRKTAFIWNDYKWKKNIIKLNASSSKEKISFFIEKKIMNFYER